MISELAEVQQELDKLKLRVEGLEERLSSLQPQNAGDEWPDYTEEVLAFTRQLFPGEVKVVETTDPEIPGDTHLVFEVKVSGTVEELAAQNDAWHRRLCRLKGRIPGRYRLSIFPE